MVLSYADDSDGDNDDDDICIKLVTKCKKAATKRTRNGTRPFSMSDWMACARASPLIDSSLSDVTLWHRTDPIRQARSTDE